MCDFGFPDGLLSPEKVTIAHRRYILFFTREWQKIAAYWPISFAFAFEHRRLNLSASEEARRLATAVIHMLYRRR
jgi:hypothetical protein